MHKKANSFRTTRFTASVSFADSRLPSFRGLFASRLLTADSGAGLSLCDCGDYCIEQILRCAVEGLIVIMLTNPFGQDADVGTVHAVGAVRRPL